MPPFLPKRLLGNILFSSAERFPALRPGLTRWGLRTRADWFLGRVPVAHSRTGRGLKLASFSQNYLSFELFWRGLDYYEPLTTVLALELSKSCGLFVDAGANIGFYSLQLAAARPDLEIVAFEPHPHLHTLLQANARANGFGRITAEPIALSDREGIMPFYLNHSHMSSSLERGFDSNHDGVVSVPVATLDTYLAARGRVPDRFLLKVDVEGHEPAFFRGAAEMLRRHRPDIIAEVAVPYPAATVAWLRRCGYRFHQITDEGLPPCTEPQAYLRGSLAFLNCLLTTRPPEEVDRLGGVIREQARSIDLHRTSKRADHRVLERCRQAVPLAQDQAG
jgi:FkbM family methyltransferase